MSDQNMTDTYRDGIHGERCSHGRSLLRAKDGKPQVSLNLEDVEALLCCLVEYVDCPEVWSNPIARLEQAIGQTYAQMKRRDKIARMETELEALKSEEQLALPTE